MKLLPILSLIVLSGCNVFTHNIHKTLDIPQGTKGYLIVKQDLNYIIAEKDIPKGAKIGNDTVLCTTDVNTEEKDTKYYIESTTATYGLQLRKEWHVTTRCDGDYCIWTIGSTGIIFHSKGIDTCSLK